MALAREFIDDGMPPEQHSLTKSALIALAYLRAHSLGGPQIERQFAWQATGSSRLPAELEG